MWYQGDDVETAKELVLGHVGGEGLGKEKESRARQPSE